MASEEDRLLEDMETSGEISTSAISSVLEENHVIESETTVHSRSYSQTFVPVEVSR